jgi:hypothetical protein
MKMWLLLIAVIGLLSIAALRRIRRRATVAA